MAGAALRGEEIAVAVQLIGCELSVDLVLDRDHRTVPVGGALLDDMVEARTGLPVLPFGVEDRLVLDPHAELLEEPLEFALLPQDVVEQVLRHRFVSRTMPFCRVRGMPELRGGHGLLDGGGEEPGDAHGVVVGLRHRGSFLELSGRRRHVGEAGNIDRAPRVVHAVPVLVELGERDGVLPQREAAERQPRDLTTGARFAEPLVNVLEEVEARWAGDVRENVVRGAGDEPDVAATDLDGPAKLLPCEGLDELEVLPLRKLPTGQCALGHLCRSCGDSAVGVPEELETSQRAAGEQLVVLEHQRHTTLDVLVPRTRHGEHSVADGGHGQQQFVPHALDTASDDVQIREPTRSRADSRSDRRVVQAEAPCRLGDDHLTAQDVLPEGSRKFTFHRGVRHRPTVRVVGLGVLPFPRLRPPSFFTDHGQKSVPAPIEVDLRGRRDEHV